MKDILPGDRVLLLQGPMGPFFKQLGDRLASQGARCWKINFNGGDWFYFRAPNALDFRGKISQWAAFLREFLVSNTIDQVYMFGDCREQHKIAREVCAELGVRVLVFEEGYIRPDYVTLEEGGVNAFSSMPRDPAFYRSLPKKPEPPRRPALFSFRRMAQAAILYYVFSTLLRWRYWRYDHHKSLCPFKKGGFWLLSGIRKKLYQSRDRLTTGRLAGELSGKYFLVPLQVHNDSQVLEHSNYGSVGEFIAEVIASFALHAPENLSLVLKHHPMNRGHRHYGSFIRELARQHGIGERVIYAHELHLPTCLEHALGVVLINSTVGLSALLHGAPTKVMGRASYDMSGLTCQKPLAEFWTEPSPVDRELNLKLRNYLIEKTQLNGSFYGILPFAMEAPAGVAAPTVRAARVRTAIPGQAARMYRSSQSKTRVEPAFYHRVKTSHTE